MDFKPLDSAAGRAVAKASYESVRSLYELPPRKGERAYRFVLVADDTPAHVAKDHS